MIQKIVQLRSETDIGTFVEYEIGVDTSIAGSIKLILNLIETDFQLFSIVEDKDFR